MSVSAAGLSWLLSGHRAEVVTSEDGDGEVISGGLGMTSRGP